MDSRLGSGGATWLFCQSGQLLSTIDSTGAEAEYLISYKLPTYWKEIDAERTKFQKGFGGVLALSSTVRPSLGNSYMLRVITFEKTDIALALQILEFDPDGAMTIAWKKLADQPTPFLLYMSDQELQEKVKTVVAEENYICDPFVVKNNWLYFLVDPNAQAKEANQLLENSLKRKGIKWRGSGGRLP